jgi:hypothetical protein
VTFEPWFKSVVCNEETLIGLEEGRGGGGGQQPEPTRQRPGCPLPGGEAADEALDYWATRALAASGRLNAAASTAMGYVAALWTPDNQWETAGALVAAYGVRVVGPFSPKNLPPGVRRVRRFVCLDPAPPWQGLALGRPVV